MLNKSDGDNRLIICLATLISFCGICSVLGNNGVSIAQVVQKKKQRTAGVAELVIITDSVKERYFRDALTIFGGMSLVRKISSVIRVYE